MKKIVILLFVGIILLSCGPAQVLPNDWRDTRLKGKVRQLCHSTYDSLVQDRIAEMAVPRLERCTRYTNKGCHSEITTAHNGIPTTRELYRYDSKGILIGYTIDQLAAERLKSYAICYKNDTLKKESIRYYYPNYSHKSFQWKTVQIRDIHGNLISIAEYTPRGELTAQRQQAFDEHNHCVIQRLWQKSPANLHQQFTYKNDFNGNPLTQIEGEGPYSGLTYRDAATKLWIAQSIPETTTTFTYQYDTKGNWIQRTAYSQNGMVQYIEKRTIDYY